MPEAGEVIELFPAGPEIEDGLAPADDLPTIVVDDTDPPPLGRTWVFDYGADTFARGGRGPIETRGIGTLIQWIEKALRTQRGTSVLHPAGYGLVDPYVMFGRPVSELSEGEITVQLQALTFHPRIVDVVHVRLLRDPSSEVAFVTYEVLTDPPTEDPALLTLKTRVGI
jgi:hypothetical protein